MIEHYQWQSKQMPFSEALEHVSYSSMMERTNQLPLQARAFSMWKNRYCNIERTAHNCLYLPSLQYISTGKFHSREQLQATGDDCHKEPDQCTTLSTEDALGVTIKYGPRAQMQLADALSQQEPHRRSSWMQELTTSPSQSHGLRSSETQHRETPSWE